MFVRFFLTLSMIAGLLIAMLLPIDVATIHSAPTQQSEPLHNLIVRVTACDTYTSLPEHCVTSEQGSGIIVDASGIVLTAYHITQNEQANDNEIKNAQAQNSFSAKSNAWSTFEVEFSAGIDGCNSEGFCKAELLASAPEYDLALLRFELDDNFSEQLTSLLDNAALDYVPTNIDSQTRLSVLGYPENERFVIEEHEIESFDENSASITITKRLQRGFSGGPVIATMNGQPSLVGIVSRLDNPNGSKTIIHTLNKLQGLYWEANDGITDQQRQFADISVVKSLDQVARMDVERLNFSALMMAMPHSKLTLLLYLFDEQFEPISVMEERSWPVSFENQLIWEHPLKGQFWVKPVNEVLDISNVFESIGADLDTVNSRLIMVDQEHRLVWSYKDWIQINRPQVIPTPTPTPDPRLLPVDLTTLNGRIAYTRLRHDDVWLTEIYCFRTNLPCKPLEHMRQPDFDTEGRLLVNGTGNGKNDIMRMDAYFGQDKLLSRHPEDQRPHWSPFGNQFVYDSSFYGDGNSRIYIQSSLGRIDSDPKSAHFAGIDFIGQYPVFLTDGRIAYQGCDRWRQGGRWCGVLVSEVPPFAVPQRITDRTDDLPTDRLDSKLLFMSKRSGNWDVYSTNLDGTNLINLTNHPADDGLATASPDNQYIAFYSNRGGQWGIYIARSDGSGVEQLLLLEGSDKKEWREERISWGP